MDLLEFLDADGAPVSLTVEGFETPVLCRILGMDEIDVIMRDSREEKSFLGFYAKLLAASVLNSDGTPFAPEERWRKTSCSQSKRFHALVAAVQKLNGMLTPKETEE